MEIAVVFVGILLFTFFRQEMQRIEYRLAGANDDAFDEAIDSKMFESSKPYLAHREKLLIEKRLLPGLELWDIAAGNWEEQLIDKAEKLRPLAEEAYGYSPDTWTFMQHADQMPMTFNYAHALANFASANKDINIKNTDWSIKKIEALALLRKRNVRLSEIVEAERELKQIERDIERLEDGIERKRKAVCDAVLERMRETWQVSDQGARRHELYFPASSKSITQSTTIDACGG